MCDNLFLQNFCVCTDILCRLAGKTFAAFTGKTSG